MITSLDVFHFIMRQGEEGVFNVLEILRDGFKTAMILSGTITSWIVSSLHINGII